MVFGWGDDDEDKKKKKQQEEKEGAEKTGRKGDEPVHEQEGKAGERPHKAHRGGRHGKDEEEHEPEPAGRPGRHGHGGKDEEGEPAAPPGRPHGKHGQEEAASSRPQGGRHGKQEEEHEPEPAGRPGRHGHGAKKDEEAGTPGPSHTTPMKVDHNDENTPAAEGHGNHGQHQGDDNNDEAKITAQPHHGGGSHNAGAGCTVTVKEGESIQDALDAASPGTTILIDAGTYHEALKSRVDGTKGQPITLRGPSNGPAAIIKGSDKSGTCVEINHDYYILDHFTIDGMIKEGNKENVRECFREKCLAIRGTREHRSLTDADGGHYLSSVDSVTVKNMKIRHCGGEGIRLRYFVTNCTIFHNSITSTGCFDFMYGGDQGMKNGEGIYIGTSSTQWEKNLTGEQDICRWNRVYENYIDTHGNECVDVKEGTMDTVIETNYCTGQLDEDSGGIDSRASTTTIRYNKIVGCKGAGVRLGGHKIGDDQYGVDCKVYCNILENNEGGGIKVMTEPHQICQNTITGDGKKYKTFRGDFAKSFEDGTECPFDVDPPKQDIETTEWFQNCKP